MACDSRPLAVIESDIFSSKGTAEPFSIHAEVYSPCNGREAIMDDYRGSIGTSDSSYYYLVISTDKATISEDDLQNFYRVGVNTDDLHVFMVVDLATDHRLRDDLLSIPGGAKLYERLENFVPAFLFSKTRITRSMMDASDIELVPISEEFRAEIDRIYVKVGLAPSAARSAILRALKAVNAYVNLKPGLFGIGVNLNQAISDLIARLEAKQP
jgi:hypothetical protein